LAGCRSRQARFTEKRSGPRKAIVQDRWPLMTEPKTGLTVVNTVTYLGFRTGDVRACKRVIGVSCSGTIHYKKYVSNTKEGLRLYASYYMVV